MTLSQVDNANLLQQQTWLNQPSTVQYSSSTLQTFYFPTHPVGAFYVFWDIFQGLSCIYIALIHAFCI
jgi:hypothetical protein